MIDSNKNKTATVKTTKLLNNTSGTLGDMKKNPQVSSDKSKSKQAKSGQEVTTDKSLPIGAKPLSTNTKSTTPVKADKAKIKPEAKPTTKASKIVSANNNEVKATSKKLATAKTGAAAKPKVSTARSKTTPIVKSASVKAKPKTSAKVKAPAKTKLSNKQSAKDLLLTQDNNVPDLNTSTGYPVHPNRIWPD